MDQGPRTKIDEHDLSRRIWERKEQAIRGALRRGVNLHIVAPSRWLADCARASSLFRELPVSVIPYGLDANLFKPCDGRGVRDALGIAPNERMILFVAQGIQDKRKGFGLLLEALSEVEMECAVKLVGIGHAQAAFRSRCKLPVVFTGTIENDAIMTMLYSAADVFVIPSLQDNLPNTVLESMACGTPVIGFDAGGIQDMVRQGETGILVPAGDCHSLSSAIISLCKNDQLRARMGSICRQVLNEKYRLAVQAQCYLDVYSSS